LNNTLEDNKLYILQYDDKITSTHFNLFGVFNVKIIVVEDDFIEAMDIRETLESFGYEVPLTIASGEEALEKIIEIKPDLVLIDIILKGEMDGIKLADEIKKMDIPIAFITALSENILSQHDKLKESYNYLSKPFKREELEYTIEKTINKLETDKGYEHEP